MECCEIICLHPTGCQIIMNSFIKIMSPLRRARKKRTIVSIRHSSSMFVKVRSAFLKFQMRIYESWRARIIWERAEVA